MNEQQLKEPGRITTEIARRDFLKTSTIAALGALFVSGGNICAAEKTTKKPPSKSAPQAGAADAEKAQPGLGVPVSNRTASFITPVILSFWANDSFGAAVYNAAFRNLKLKSFLAKLFKRDKYGNTIVDIGHARTVIGKNINLKVDDEYVFAPSEVPPNKGCPDALAFVQVLINYSRQRSKEYGTDAERKSDNIMVSKFVGHGGELADLFQTEGIEHFRDQLEDKDPKSLKTFFTSKNGKINSNLIVLGLGMGSVRYRVITAIKGEYVYFVDPRNDKQEIERIKTQDAKQQAHAFFVADISKLPVVPREYPIHKTFYLKTK